MRVINDRRQDGCWTTSPFGMRRLVSFHHGPAIIAPPFNPIEHLPAFPADIADPQIAGLAIETHPPGISQSIRPNFAPRPGAAHEGIFGRNSIVFAVVRLIDIDSQDRGQQVTEILTRLENIRGIRRPRITRRNIQVTVRAKLQRAAIVPP